MFQTWPTRNSDVVATIASQFADGRGPPLAEGRRSMVGFEASEPVDAMGERKGVIAPERIHYLSSEIASTMVSDYHAANTEPSPRNLRSNEMEDASVSTSKPPPTTPRTQKLPRPSQDHLCPDRRDLGGHGRSQGDARQRSQLPRNIASAEYTYSRAWQAQGQDHDRIAGPLEHFRVALPKTQDDGEQRLHHEGERTVANECYIFTACSRSSAIRVVGSPFDEGDIRAHQPPLPLPQP